MTDDALWLLACFALVFVINLVPAFMPSTWMLLSFFYIKFDPPLLILTLGGALVSGLGRIVLARGSTWVKRRFMATKQADLDELGAFLDERRHYVGATVFLYALSPLPTNNLFIAAGMAEVRMVSVLAGFWSARAIADTLLVWTTDRVFDTIEDVFAGAWGNWLVMALQLAGLASVVLLYMLPWARWLRRIARPRDRRPDARPN